MKQIFPQLRRLPEQLTGVHFDAGTPAVVFQSTPRQPVLVFDHFVYDVSRDGQRFLINRQVKQAESAPMSVVPIGLRCRANEPGSRLTLRIRFRSLNPAARPGQFRGVTGKPRGNFFLDVPLDGTFDRPVIACNFGKLESPIRA